MFNILGLPSGIMWSNILSPLFLLWLIKIKKYFLLVIFFNILLLYAFIQLITSPYDDFIEINSFVLSAGYFFTTFIATVYIYYYLQKVFLHNKIEELFVNILKINSILLFIAIIIYFSPLREFFWGISTQNAHIEGQVRLKLFFSEPAHYGYVLMVFLTYITLQVFLRKQYQYVKLFIVTLVSAWLTQSMGTIGAIVLAISIASLVYFYPLFKKMYKQITMIIIFLVLLMPFVGEVFLNRMDKVIAGEDHSGKVRVVYSTISAYELIEKYNYFVGVGFGQTKFHVQEFTSQFQGYKTNRLPSSFASTLATVGIIGISLKYLILLILFIKRKTYRNILQLTLFLYAFIYGFTGGWMLNFYEFFIWVLVFSRVFPEFDYSIVFKKSK